jgi:MraZ protein
MLTGEYDVLLDDTGRIALPRRLRDVLGKEKVILTKGSNVFCLWLYGFEQGREMLKIINEITNPFSERDGDVRRLLGAAQELDIDRQGRILIPPTLRDFAGLTRKCLVLGQFDFIEIWDEERYKSHWNTRNNEFKASSEELGVKIMKKRNGAHAGNSPYAGVVGGDHTISGTEGKE